MNFLAQQQINEVLVEAGSVLNGALLTEDLIDELDCLHGSFHLGGSRTRIVSSTWDHDAGE